MKKVIIGSAVILLFFIGHCTYRYNDSQTQISITVTEKERVSDGENSKYLVWTENETFECTDEMFLGKYNSSDIYGKLHPGHTYKVTVVGWRNHFFSTYRNIISIDSESESVWQQLTNEDASL